MEWALALLALALVGVAAVSQRLSGTPVTPAMVFVAFGLLVGPEVFGGIEVSSTSSAVRVLAEATLAMVLFSDASRIDVGALRRTVGVPARLLGVGLPLTIALGAGAAAAVFGELSVEEAVILEEIGDGVVGGVIAGLLVAAIITRAGRLKLIATSWQRVIPAADAALDLVLGGAAGDHRRMLAVCGVREDILIG